MTALCFPLVISSNCAGYILNSSRMGQKQEAIEIAAQTVEITLEEIANKIRIHIHLHTHTEELCNYLDERAFGVSSPSGIYLVALDNSNYSPGF